MRIAPLAPVLLALATTALAAPAWPGAVDYPGAHYRLRTDVDPELARDLAAMLDAQHDRLLDIFGRAPDGPEPLPVRLFARHEDYVRLVGNTGGGIYTYGNRTANVWIQPHVYWTRHLLLHETTHQWIHLAFARNRALLPWWLDEGLAEYAAFHVWDGTTLRTGLHDVITLKDYVVKSREITGRDDWDVSHTLAGGMEGDRAEAWALVHHLMTASAKSRKALLRLLAEIPRKVHVEDRAEVERAATALFRRRIARRLEDVTAAVREHANGLERTWSILTVAWDRRGETITGRSETTAVLRYVHEELGPTAEVSFRFRVLGGAKGWVGLAHEVRGLHEFDVVTLTSPGQVLWNGLHAGGWTRHGVTGAASAADRAWHDVTVRFRETAVEVEIDGRALPPLARPDAEPLETVGLFVDGAAAEFRDFRVVAGRR